MATSKFELFKEMTLNENDFIENKILLKVTKGKKYVDNVPTNQDEYKYELLAMGRVNDILVVRAPALFVNLEELKAKKKMLVKTKQIQVNPYEETKTGQIKWTGTVESIEVVKGQEAKIFDDLFKVE
jgi:hypothetical protein